MSTSSVPKLQRHKSAHGRLQSSASVAPAGTDARHETQGERPSVGKPGRSRRAKSARETRTLERGSSQELAKSGGWGSTQYGDDFGPKEPVTPVPVRPISPTRRNNPHPAMVSRSSYSISAQLAARLDSSPAHLLLLSTNHLQYVLCKQFSCVYMCSHSCNGSFQFVSTPTRSLSSHQRRPGSTSVKAFMKTTQTPKIVRFIAQPSVKLMLVFCSAGDAKNEVPVTNLAKIKFPGNKQLKDSKFIRTCIIAINVTSIQNIYSPICPTHDEWSVWNKGTAQPKGSGTQVRPRRLHMYLETTLT